MKTNDKPDVDTLPADVTHLLEEGVLAFDTDPALAERCFRKAQALSPEALRQWFCTGRRAGRSVAR